jgi:hypothetical protein
MGAERGGARLQAAVEEAGGQQPGALDPDRPGDASLLPRVMVEADGHLAAALEAHEVEDHGERHHPGRQLYARHEIPAVVAGVARADLGQERD